MDEVRLQTQMVNRTDGSAPYLLEGFTNFNRHEQQKWFEENWTIAFYFVAAYVLFIFTGQEVMKSRKPLNLKTPIILWNLLLAVFSITACVRILPEFHFILMGQDGVYKSVCNSVEDVSDQGMFWGWMFTLSKIVELGDTVFLILRKRKLIFLHWYHHITVLLYCWANYSSHISTARWFITVNYCIHAIMYSYYSLRSLNVPIRKSIAMAITSLQLSQMVIGVGVNGYAYAMKMSSTSCDVSLYHLNFGLLMYASYFVLFAHFFHTAYIKHGKEKMRQQQQAEQDNKEKVPSLDSNANHMDSKHKSFNKSGVKVD